MTFRKTGTEREIAFEIAGLADLENAGSTVATVVDHGDTWLETRTISTVPATKEHARQLGHMLATQHQAVDRPWGAPPPDFDLDRFGGGAMGRTILPLGQNEETWGEFYARSRIAPYLEIARDKGELSAADASVIDTVMDRLVNGDFETGDQPSILHGDLWSGNVMFSADGPVLIDPACHSGHRESDLAQLLVFGIPYGEEIYAAYNESFPLADGWRERIDLHQLHIIIVHAALFTGYGPQTVSLARRYL